MACKYDFFIAGRWRNHKAINEVLQAVRASGKTAYCFIENSYEGEKIELRQDDGIEASMQATESLPINDPFMKQIFTKDIEAQKDSAALLLVFPAGLAAHMEAGISYGLGRPCYAIYQPEKTETLYNIFEEVFPDLSSLEGWLKLQVSSHLSKEHDETRRPLSNI
jgi:hypothetical protein